MTTPAACLDCGLPYERFPLDVHLPRGQWLAIHPDEHGLLCAACIVARAGNLPGAVVVHAIIEIRPGGTLGTTFDATTTTTPSLDTLSGRVAYEIARAGDRAMCELYPDLPVLHWTRLDDGTLVGIVGERHVANGTLARWVERLGLVTALSDWDRPGLSRYVGTVDGITIEISGITDRAVWDAARPA